MGARDLAVKVNVDELEWSATRNEGPFGARRKQLAAPTGARLLGCSLYELAPGKRAWPAHMHFGNEEAYYVLEGTGTVRLGDEEFAVPPHHWVALPPNTGRAHQMRNTSDAPLTYLCLSTMEAPDVVYYPDSQKIGVLCGAAPGGSHAQRTLQAWLPASAAVSYWHGELPDEGSAAPPQVVVAPEPERWPPIAGPGEGMAREVEHGRVKVHGETLGVVAGSNKLGCTKFTCAAGRYSFPRHAHTANEEALFVLKGSGVSIAGDEETAIRAGDYVTYPADASLAHHVRADEGADLVYLAFSTKRMPEVVLYPDSNKVGIMGPGLRSILDAQAQLDYFDREPDQ